MLTKLVTSTPIVALTQMLCCAHSAARVRTSWLTPPLLAA
jgi:hypothetical protein